MDIRKSKREDFIGPARKLPERKEKKKQDRTDLPLHLF